MEVAVPATPRRSSSSCSWHGDTSTSNTQKRKSDGSLKQCSPSSYGRSRSNVDATRDEGVLDKQTNRIQAPIALQRRRSINIPPLLSIPSSYLAMTTCIVDYLLLGTTGDALLNDAEALRSMSIYYIVDCCSERRGSMRNLQRHRLLKAELGFTVVKLNLKDEADAELKPAFDLVLPVVRKAKLEGKKCLIHCHSGMSRSVSMALACLVVLEHMTLLNAMRLVKERRLIASPNPGFMAQLIDLEQAVDRERGGRGVGIPSVDLSRYTHDRFAKPEAFAAKANVGMDDTHATTQYVDDDSDNGVYWLCQGRSREHSCGDAMKEDFQTLSFEETEHRRRRRRRVDNVLQPKQSNTSWSSEKPTTGSSFLKGNFSSNPQRLDKDTPLEVEASGFSFCVGGVKDASFSDLLCGASHVMELTSGGVKSGLKDAPPTNGSVLTPVSKGVQFDDKGNTLDDEDDEMVVPPTDCVSSTYVAPIAMAPSDDCKWSDSMNDQYSGDDGVVKPLKGLQLSTFRRKSLIRYVSESDDGEDE